MAFRTQTIWRGLNNLGRVMSFRDAGISPARGTSMWELCPWLATLQEPGVAFHYHNDFLTLEVDDTTGNPTGGLFSGDTATGSITLPKVTGGAIQLATGAVDNNETYLQLGAGGSTTAAPFVITDSSGKAVFFEVYAKALQHADMGVFIGLAEENCAAGNFLVDNTGAVADKDFIGFNILTATPTAWNATWKKAGQTVQAVTGVATNADDFHRFGFVFDGASTVYFYVDRTLVSTQALTSAATFPSGQNLAPIFAVKTGEGVAKSIQVDYIDIWQAR